MLRRRILTLLVSLLAGLLLFVGGAVYAFQERLLRNQVDQLLLQTAKAFISKTTVEPLGDGVRIKPPPLDFTANLYIQLWGFDQEGRPNLVTYSGNLKRYQAEPLSVSGLRAVAPEFRNETVGQIPMRVLSVPLLASQRPFGVLQVGMEISGLLAARRSLLILLVVTVLLTSLLVLIMGYWGVGLVLAPLEEATEIAYSIVQTGDLSRRIPVPNRSEDEVGTLVRAFNETLARLERLFQSQRRFLADVGHELRTPLTVIRGNVELMERMGHADPELLRDIRAEVDRLQRLVEDLVLLVQAEVGQLPLRHGVVALDDLMLDAARTARHLAASEKPSLRVEVSELEPLQVCGDEDRLRQVLLNLVSNAVKYTPDGGLVRLSLRRHGAQAWMTVQDSGPGIAPEDLPYVFDRFYRADRARRRGKGFGLGLSIAYWIVRHHGGDIAVYSRLGEGATFVVRLPLWEEGRPCPPGVEPTAG